MTENKRYYIGNGKNCTICDNNQKGSDFYNMLTQFEAVDRLNEQEERIQELEERNQRQYKRLQEVWDLIFKRDWETLEQKASEIEKQEELLKREWRAYNNCVQ